MKVGTGPRIAHHAAQFALIAAMVVGIAASYFTYAAYYDSMPSGNLSDKSFQYIFDYNNAVGLWTTAGLRDDVKNRESYLKRIQDMARPPVVRIERGPSVNSDFAFSAAYKLGENVGSTPAGGLVDFTVLSTGDIAAPSIKAQLHRDAISNYTEGAVLRARIDNFHKPDTYYEGNGQPARMTVYLNQTTGDATRGNGAASKWFDDDVVLNFPTFKCVHSVANDGTQTVKTWFLTQLTIMEDTDATTSDPFKIGGGMESGAGTYPYGSCDPDVSNDPGFWTLGYEKSSSVEDLTQHCNGVARRPSAANLPLDILVRSPFDPYVGAIGRTDCTEEFPLVKGESEGTVEETESEFGPMAGTVAAILFVAICLEAYYRRAVKKAAAVDGYAEAGDDPKEIPAGFYYDEARAAFAEADTNGDGVLDANELFAVLTKLGFFAGVPYERIEKMVGDEFAKADVNARDNKITLEEFMPYFEQVKRKLDARNASKKLVILGGAKRGSLNHLSRKAFESGGTKSSATMRYVFAKGNVIFSAFFVAEHDPYSRFERIWGLFMVQLLVTQIIIVFASTFEFNSTEARICDPQSCEMVKQRFCSTDVGNDAIKTCFNSLSEGDHIDIGHLRDIILDYETCTTQNSKPMEDLMPWQSVIQSMIVLLFRVPFTLLWEKLSRCNFTERCAKMELGRLVTIPISLIIVGVFAALLAVCWPVDTFMYDRGGDGPSRCAVQFGIQPPDKSFFGDQKHCSCFPEVFLCDYEFAREKSCVEQMCFRNKYGTVIIAVVYALIYTLIGDAIMAYVKCSTGMFRLKHLKEDVEKHNKYVEDHLAGVGYRLGTDPEAGDVARMFPGAADDAKKKGGLKGAAGVAAVDSAVTSGEEVGEEALGVEVVADWGQEGEEGAFGFATDVVGDFLTMD